MSQHLDSELGRWIHTEWRPDGEHPLGWAVERVWDFDGMASAPRERVFPNGMVELIVQLDDPYFDVLGAGTAVTPATCVTGIHSRTLVVEAPRRRCRVIGVRFHPPGAWALLGHPLSELADLTANLEDLLGRAAVELGLGPGIIMLGSAPEDELGFSIYVYVEDLDAHYARARAAGAEIVRPLADTSYGSREYGARDLEGHLWFFGTYLPAELVRR